MLKNLHLKFIALVAATIFWVFVVSLENTFFKLPNEVPIQVFNRAEELALAQEPGSVRLTLRTADSLVLRNLGTGDFEAYIDLRNVGAGKIRIPVSVTSRNPQVTIVRVEPAEAEVELEPVREKILTLQTSVRGEPAEGFRVASVRLTRETITVAGAESLLKKISGAKAEIVLQGTEGAGREEVRKSVEIKILDRDGVALSGITVLKNNIEAVVAFSEAESSLQIGVKAKITGAVTNGVVKKITVIPAVVLVVGNREVLSAIEVIETEPIDLKDLDVSGEKKVKLVLPEGVSLAKGEPKEAVVKVEVERISNNQ